MYGNGYPPQGGFYPPQQGYGQAYLPPQYPPQMQGYPPQHVYHPQQPMAHAYQPQQYGHAGGMQPGFPTRYAGMKGGQMGMPQGMPQGMSHHPAMPQQPGSINASAMNVGPTPQLPPQPPLQQQASTGGGMRAGAPTFVPGGGATATQNTDGNTDPVNTPLATTVASEPEANKANALVVSLEEVAFFMEDMERTVWWLIKAAKTIPPSKNANFGSQSPNTILIKGDEVLPDNLEKEPWFETLQKIESNVLSHIESHENQLRSKMFIVTNPTEEQRELLNVLKNLRFNCQGQIIIFDIPSAELNHRALWNRLQTHLMEKYPVFGIKADLVEGGFSPQKYFMQCLSIVPIVLDRGRIRLFGVFYPDKKRRHWSFVGGEIKVGAHRNLAQAANLIWYYSVGVFYGESWSWDKTFLPSKNFEPFLYVAHERDGSKYPVKPYLFLEATPEFYAYTCEMEAKAKGPSSTTSTGGEPLEIPSIPDPTHINFIRHDEKDPSMTKLVHTKGDFYKQFDHHTWLDLDFYNGQLSTTQNDGCQIRRDVEVLFKQQPKKIWSSLLGPLLGKTEEECNSILGKDLPTEPPFSIMMSGIDKQATDEDIHAFFIDSAPHCKIKVLEQLEEPRHTAKVEFYDQASLRAALRRHHANLKRRKVKIELCYQTVEGGKVVSRTAPAGRAEYQGPLPDSPPYQVLCRNLDRSVNENELGYFFWDREAAPTGVELNEVKHTGIVSFANLEELKAALKWSGSVFKGRTIDIKLYQPGMEVEKESKVGEKRKGKGKDSRKDRVQSGDHFGMRFDKGFDRDRYNRDHQRGGFERNESGGYGRNSGGFDRQAKTETSKADVDDNWRRG